MSACGFLLWLLVLKRMLLFGQVGRQQLRNLLRKNKTSLLWFLSADTGAWAGANSRTRLIHRRQSQHKQAGRVPATWRARTRCGVQVRTGSKEVWTRREIGHAPRELLDRLWERNTTSACIVREPQERREKLICLDPHWDVLINLRPLDLNFWIHGCSGRIGEEGKDGKGEQ